MTTRLKGTQTAKVSAFLPRGLRDDLERVARSHDRSLSGELREAVREHVANCGNTTTQEVER
jgi:Arc-like DNA binding domain